MECKQCGQCCCSLIIEIDHLDIVREPKLAEHAVLLDGNGTMKYESDWEKIYNLTFCKPCPMIEDNKCSIYPTRPNCCVGFKVGSEQCKFSKQESGT